MSDPIDEYVGPVAPDRGPRDHLPVQDDRYPFGIMNPGLAAIRPVRVLGLIAHWRQNVLAIGPYLEGAAFEQCAGAVFTRDKNTCRRCGVKVTRTVERLPNRAEAHHIRERAHVATRYDVRNGLTTCAACHERLTGTIGAPKLFVIATQFFTLNGDTYTDATYPVRFSETKPV